jgi:3-isopropylmalate dehydrogenase
VVEAVLAASGQTVEVRFGGDIGRLSERAGNAALPVSAQRFCEQIFAEGGVILNGPGGGRYVYDLRRTFDLFFKISPIQARYAALDAGRLRPERLTDLDLIVTRENSGGVYQGEPTEGRSADGSRWAAHTFRYDEAQVQRFLDASARLAASRRGRLTVVWKDAGATSMSRLWRAVAEDAAARAGVSLALVDVDLMAYRVIQHHDELDVVAAPNLFGDVIGDLAAALLGSRGNSFSGNYTAAGDAVYQTNHGSAYDLAGTDRANPCGQIFSVAMMLRESFALEREATAIERGVRAVWSAGLRTADVAAPGCRVVGTQALADEVVRASVRAFEAL